MKDVNKIPKKLYHNSKADTCTELTQKIPQKSIIERGSNMRAQILMAFLTSAQRSAKVRALQRALY